MQLVAIMLLSVIAVIVIGFAAGGYFLSRNIVPAVMLPETALRQLIEVLQLTDQSVLYDLGCGNGRVLRTAHIANPAAHLLGVENNPLLWAWAKLRLGRRVTVVRGDLLRQDLRSATHVFTYLGPGLMAQLEPKFERELAPGSRVVSVQFPLQRRPVKTIELKGSAKHAERLFIYEF